MAWYSRGLDNRIPLPELTSGETIMFRQFGYAISSTKYDPARIVVTDRRLFLQPIRFNPGGRIPDLEAPLGEVSVAKDRDFGRHLARPFQLMAFRQKMVFEAAGRRIACRANLGYPLPSLQLFARSRDYPFKTPFRFPEPPLSSTFSQERLFRRSLLLASRRAK